MAAEKFFTLDGDVEVLISTWCTRTELHMLMADFHLPEGIPLERESLLRIDLNETTSPASFALRGLPKVWGEKSFKKVTTSDCGKWITSTDASSLDRHSPNLTALSISSQSIQTLLQKPSDISDPCLKTAEFTARRWPTETMCAYFPKAKV